MSYSSLAQLVQHFESGGDYSIINQTPTSYTSGAYQFTNGTWQQYAPLAGVDTAIYPTAASAPPSLQDQVFQAAVQQNGLNDWTCPGCDPALTQYIANNPSVLSLPILNGGTSATGLTSGTGSGTQTSPDASASSNASGCTGWISTPVACITASLTELGLIILGLLVLGVGLWMLGERETQ